MICPSCASPVPDSARFCPNCGHLLQGSDERRIVTVLFADLVGFTALGEQRDPEQLKIIVDRCFERLVADITAFGGSVDKIVGDAVVALFGAPLAHEDDPERAVRAALRMQRTVGEVSAELDTPIRMRIGVNTGEVLVGALRAGGDYTAMGDTVNLASRLEATAAPGEVFVGPSTYEATSEVVRYESRGTMAVRGREGAIDVHAAVEELTLPGRRPRAQRAPLVGRDAELSLLGAAVEAAVERRHAHLLVIPGEAGQGKTRLAEEVALQTELTHDALVLEGRCLPYGETSPWWPIAESIRQQLRLSPLDPPTVVRERIAASVQGLLDEDHEQVTTGLAQLMGVEEHAGSIDRSRARDEVIDALHRYLAAILSERPVVIVVSDVHWADQALLELAERLLVSLQREPFVIIATTRWSGDDERWVAQTGRHNTVVCNLLPLDRGATARLAAALLGTDVSAELADDLYERSGGNPFFLEELVNLLSESAAGPAPDDTGPLRTELPGTLRGLVSARLDALTPEQRGMVQDAAVIGRDGPVYALVLMAQGAREDEAPEHAFRQLVAKDIFETNGPGWRFRSDLVREVAYSTLTKVVRASKHAGIGDWLETHPEQSDTTLRAASRVAYHFYTAATLAEEIGEIAGLPSDLRIRAIDSLERVAELAEQADSNYAAGKAHARVLELARDDEADRRLRALLGRATVRLDLRELRGARDDGESAMSVAEVNGDRSAVAQALTLLSEVSVLEGDIEQARSLVEDSIALWRDIGDRAGHAEALRQRGFISMRAGDRIEAELAFRTALDIYRELGDQAGEGWCLQNLAWLAFEQGDVVTANDHLINSMTLFEEVGDLGGIGWATGLLAYVRYYEGRTVEAEELATSTLVESERRGEPWATGMMSVLLASISLWSGRGREAVERATSAYEVLDRIDDDYGRVQALAVLGRSQLAVGRTAEAQTTLALAEQVAAGMPGRPVFDFAEVVLLSAAVQRGDGASALSIAEEFENRGGTPQVGEVDRSVALALMELQTDTGDPRTRLDRLAAARGDGQPSANIASAQALAAAVAGDTRAAIAFADSLDAEASTFVDRRTAQLAAGLAAARSGRQDESIDRFERAVADVDRTDSRLSQAIVRVARAIAYQALDLPEAPELSAEAERRAAELGLSLDGWRHVFALAVGSGRAPEVPSLR